eukprot:scaffold17980_cov40-Cyclotella_meneghiniana.AAC.5
MPRFSSPRPSMYGLRPVATSTTSYFSVVESPPTEGSMVIKRIVKELACLRAGEVEFGCDENYDDGDGRDLRRAAANKASASADA